MYGIVIHSIKDSQDIRFMGNISFQIPLTSTCLIISNFALCGIGYLFLLDFSLMVTSNKVIWAYDQIITIFLSPWNAVTFWRWTLCIWKLLVPCLHNWRLCLIEIYIFSTSPAKISPVERKHLAVGSANIEHYFRC